MSQFISWCSMGGYSVYVWSAYGLVTLVLFMNYVAVRAHKKRIHQKLRQWLKE